MSRIDLVLVRLHDGAVLLSQPFRADQLALGTIEVLGVPMFEPDGPPVSFTGFDVDAFAIVAGESLTIFAGFEVVRCEHGFAKAACPECSS